MVLHEYGGNRTAVVSVCKLHGAFSANKYTKVRRWSFFAIGWQFQELGGTIPKKNPRGLACPAMISNVCVGKTCNPKSKKRRQWGEHNEYIIIIRNPRASIKNRYESSRIENPNSCRKVWILHLRRPVLDTRLWKRTISGGPACFKYLQKIDARRMPLLAMTKLHGTLCYTFKIKEALTRRNIQE